MKVSKFGLAGMVGLMLALPAAAQTLQTTPTKPTVTKPTAVTPGSATSRPASSSASSLVDINSAPADTLDKLPGIGKTRAEAIIKGRPYKGKDDLVNRHVLPQNIYNGVKDRIIAKQS